MRDGLVNNRHRSGSLGVGAIEVASGHESHSHGREIPWRE